MAGYAGPADAREVFAITAAPAIAMALGSAAIRMGEPSERVQARLQHLSAGLLIGAVLTEIFPILKMRLTAARCGPGVCWSHLLAAIVGFCAALILMYSVKSLDLEGGADGDDEGPGTPKQLALAQGSEAPQQEGEEQQQRQGRTARHNSYVWIPGASAGRNAHRERSRLRMTFSRLQQHSDALLRLVESDEVQSEGLDEEIHGIDFLVDSARRLCRGAEPIDKPTLQRLRAYTGLLLRDITRIREIDVRDPQAIDKQLTTVATTLRNVHLHTERATFRRWVPRQRIEGPSPPEASGEDSQADAEGAVASPAEAAKVPWGLIIAVVVDSVIDGMLIGLAGSVAWTSGMLMAVATAIEMAFLGFSFACSLAKVIRQRIEVVAALGLPPLAMLASSVLAAVGAGYLEDTPAFCGLVAFALVAVLFLVLQELLIEAHEKEGGQEWHITVWLYAGLLLSITLDVVF